MSETADWLQRHGLVRYAALFAQHDIKLDIIKEFTDEEFAGIGISVGDRKRLHKAIAELRHAGPSYPQKAKPVDQHSLGHGAERRHLTVMFCDLVGSTPLSIDLELEDFRKVIRSYQNTCVPIIEHYGGVVSRYIGDGLLVFFGHPEAHEDDPERAVHAALSILEKISELNDRDELPGNASFAVRIGIATGLVIVGDIIGEKASEVNAIVGETPNLAARLQSLAEPNTVIIADSTRRLLGGLFEFRNMGPQALKGFPQPEVTWQVLHRRVFESRFDATRATYRSPFVGRSEEFALIRRRWSQCLQGEGHVMVLSGEPGIGKSRMVGELRRSLEGELQLTLLYQCSPHHINSALYPIIQQLERAAGFGRSDSSEVKRSKLQDLLTQHGHVDAESLPLFATLLSIPPNGGYNPLHMTPERQKEATFEELIRGIEQLAARKPILVVFEDVHWIDPTSLEFLQRCIERSQSLKILLVITCRPEFDYAWSHFPHLTYLALSRLDRNDASAIVSSLAADIDVPETVTRHIVEKTDGVALFVEEVTKGVIESGWLDRPDNAKLSSLSTLSIPDTLQDSLMARLDRLSESKQVAQIGATIGREFSYDLISRVSSLPEEELRSALDKLTESGLLFSRPTPEDISYRFKHALVQETAYSSLLNDNKVYLHGQIARVLRQTSAQARFEPEIIAYHYSQAQDFGKAVSYWRLAGERAAARSANAEAFRHFEQAHTALHKLPACAQRNQDELDLLVELGAVQVAIAGYSSPEVEHTYMHALELSQGMEEKPDLCFILSGIGAYYCVSGQLRYAEESARRCLDLASRIGGSEHLVDAHRTLGEVLFYAGDLHQSRIHLEQCLVLYDIEQHADVAITSGDDPSASCSMYLAIVLWLMGKSDEALQEYENGLALATELNHLHTLAATRFNAAWFHALRGDWRQVTPLAKASIDLCKEHGFLLFLGIATVLEGWSVARDGRHNEGIERMQEGMKLIEEDNAGVCLSCFLPWLAEGLALAGEYSAAMKTLRKAYQCGDERIYDAERFRLEGDILALQGSDPVKVESCYVKAIDRAREQGILVFELRSILCLCRYWQRQDRVEEAHKKLSSACKAFTHEFDAPELESAQALLDELAQGL
jgi:predicted ATPase/class 3 adenylate cyclase